MRRGGKRFALAGALAVVAVVGFSSTALADDSQIRISEVYLDGSASHGDFVELQMLADGQTIPANAAIRMCNANASLCINFLFPPNSLAASTSQRTILFGWDDNSNTDFGIPAATSPPNLNNFPLTGGHACYMESVAPNIPIDCVSWGNSTGTAPSVGSPAPALNASQSLTRTEARGCSTLMEAIDDSDNSSADFSLATPSPRNNLATPTEHACPPPAVVTPKKKKCKKKKKHRSAETAKKKKCKKKK